MGVIYLIIAGQFVSLIGTGIQITAIPLYILQTTHSGLLVSISQIITIAVTVLVSPAAGVLGDRYNKKKILIGSDLISFVIVFGIFALFSLGATGIPFIYLCQALCAASECILVASIFAIVPDLVPKDKITKANGFRSMATSSALFIGPILGGVVFALLGMKYVFLINALSFLFSASLAGFIHYRRRTPARAERLSIHAFVEDIREIAKYLKENRNLRKLAVFAVVLNMASAPVLYVILPFLIITVIKMTSQQYGLIQGFYMGGFFIGGLLLSALKLKNVNRVVRIALFVMTIATLVLSFVSFPEVRGLLGGVAAISILNMLIGCSDSICNTIVQAEIQKTARIDMMSRIGGVMNMFFQASIPAGLFIVGLLIDHVPLYLVFVPIALFLVVYTAIASRGLLAGAET